MAIHKIDGVDGVNHFPKKFVELHSLVAVTKGDFLMIETDTTVTDYDKNGLGATVIKAVASASTGLEAALIVGVAAETTTAAGTVKIQVAGKFENANCHTDIVRGEGICVLNSTAGQGVPYITSGSTRGLPVAVALEDAPSTGAATDIMILDSGMF